MARKGAAQQLQTKIETNDELDEYLQQKGLLLLEIYSEWFGPCTAMNGVLRKIKMEIGGDNLHLAAVQCNQIDRFQRFLNTSEPVWMLVANGKMLSCVLGANVPQLTNEIQTQLANIDQQQQHKTYELNELSPIELKRYELATKFEQQKELLAAIDARRKYVENLKYVTNKIRHHMADMGVTILLPHVYHSQLYQELAEVGNSLKMVAKYRDTCRILPEHLNIINFDSSNCGDGMPMDLWDHIVDKDILMICWKISDDELRPVEEMCNQLVKIVTDGENNSWQPSDDTDEPIAVHLRPIVFQKKLIDTAENLMSDEVLADEEFEAMKNEVNRIIAELFDEHNSDCVEDKNRTESEILMHNEINRIISKTLLARKSNAKNKLAQENVIKTEIMNILLNINDREYNIGDFECPQYVVKPNADASDIIPTYISKLNGIWTPSNKTTNALLIYLYFRSVTEHFLPPDRGPEKPHLLMIFDISKRRSVLNVIEKYQSDILAFGYFTIDNNATNVTKLIAKTNLSYENVRFPKPSETKIVLKIANDTNDTLYALANCEPNYISQNTASGSIDCQPYFPPDYPFGIEITDIQFGCASIVSNTSNKSNRLSNRSSRSKRMSHMASSV